MRATREGCKSYSDGESWVNWWTLPIEATDEQVKDFIIDNDITRYSGGPGSGYAQKAIIRRSLTRVLITQSCGLDI